LANRLKVMSMSAYSSDEDDTESAKRSPQDKKSPSNGSAFAEVVRATMRAREEEQAAAAAAAAAAQKQ